MCWFLRGCSAWKVQAPCPALRVSLVDIIAEMQQDESNFKLRKPRSGLGTCTANNFRKGPSKVSCEVRSFEMKTAITIRFATVRTANNRDGDQDPPTTSSCRLVSNWSFFSQLTHHDCIPYRGAATMVGFSSSYPLYSSCKPFHFYILLSKPHI